MKKLTITVGVISALLAGTASAEKADIVKSLSKLNIAEKDIKIADSPVTGFKSVTTPEGIFYVSDDGNFLTQGPIYSLKGDRPENIANDNNLKLVKSIDKNAIVYEAKDPKYTIYVFTDYTCGYCKKLHEEIDSYLNLGISVHYFAFPRQGLDSEVAKNMQYIWNTKDRKKAFDAAYKGNEVKAAAGMVPYVQMQYDIGRQLGIAGTPAIVLPNGQLLSGYIPANELIKILNQYSQ